MKDNVLPEIHSTHTKSTVGHQGSKNLGRSPTCLGTAFDKYSSSSPLLSLDFSVVVFIDKPKSTACEQFTPWYSLLKSYALLWL